VIMLIDRELQLSILTELSEVYPSSINLSNRYEYGSEDYRKFVANLAYLRDYNLISQDSILTSRTMGSSDSQPNLGAITHKGIDFLADDGGLGAILGVVTIKFEAEQLKSILAGKILSSELSDDKKQRLVDALWEMPAEGLKHLTTKIVDTGWSNLASLMIVLQSSILYTT
jgi:hypothetical protein